MTAEVAVVNRSAVALAADSLATTLDPSDREPQKTHEVNKVFALSKHHPVGVMVYNVPDFMQVPWETAVELYRRRLGDRSFDTIRHYADDFLDWVAASELTAPEETQRGWFRSVLVLYFAMLDDTIDERVKEEVDGEAQVSHERIVEIVDGTIEEHRDKLSDRPERPHLTTEFAAGLSSDYKTEIDEAISDRIAHKPLSSTALRYLHEIASFIFCRDVSMPRKSGVVVAGFGEKEVFPAVQAFSVYGAAKGRPISIMDEQDSIAPGTNAVLPFAQRDVVYTFLQGVDNETLETIADYQGMLFNRLPAIIADSIDYEESKKSEIVRKLEGATSEVTETFRKRLEEWLRKRHIDPFLEVLHLMPKEELAELAESLVSLTSMKRKVSLGIETVGGPIDVAIISKGDGFVWTRRKHYFDPALNQAFLATYIER